LLVGVRSRLARSECHLRRDIGKRPLAVKYGPINNYLIALTLDEKNASKHQ
jgi:hypothetical protein